MFDWISFFRAHLIPFKTKGKQIARGRLGIQCPFCGPADKSEHMGIDPRTGRYDCWRDKQHGGSNPARLVSALLGIRFGEAEKLVAQFTEAGSTGTAESLGALRDRLGRMKSPQRPAYSDGGLSYPADFRPADGRFISYLAEDRDYGPDAPEVARLYKLQRSLVGQWAYRLIVPLYDGGKLVAWQGRIIGGTGLRYLTAPDGGAAKQYLWNADGIREGGETLVLCEGPFDAMRVDFYGRAHGVRAAAMMGVSPTTRQIARIHEAAPRFRRIVILFDRNATSKALYLARYLGTLNVTIGSCEPYKDPGEFPPEKVVDLFAGACNSKGRAVAFPGIA